MADVENDARRNLHPGKPEDSHLVDPSSSGRDQVPVSNLLGGTAPKSADVASLFDFFRYAYSQTGRRIVFKKKMVRQVRQAPELHGAEWQAARVLAEEDESRLAVPLQILHAIQREGVDGHVRTATLGTVSWILRAHPLCSSEVVQNALLSPEFAQGDQVMSDIVAMPEEEVEERLGPNDLKPSEIDELRANLVNTLGLYMALHQSWRPEQLAGVLYASLWRNEAERDELADHPLVALTVTQKAVTLARVAEAWMRGVDEARERAAEATRQLERSRAEREQLQGRLDAVQQTSDHLRNVIADLEVKISALEDEIEAERQLRDEGRAHASYDYEMLRSRWLQRLKRQNTLLEEGLLALRRDPPKAHVAIDRMERALEGMSGDLADLKGDGGDQQ